MSDKSKRRHLISIDQASQELQVSPRSVRRYIASGLLKAHRIGPRLIRIDAESLDAMVGSI
jgi:excisionase family DNA binding protein